MAAIVAVWIVAALASATSLADVVGSKGFLLQARTLTALEGGPAVLEVTLSYMGEQEVITKDWTGLHVKLVGPEGWNERVYETLGGNARGHAFKKGDKVKKTIYLQREYTSIPKGKAHFEITWRRVVAYEDGREEIPSCSIGVDVDVLAATKERVKALSSEIEKKLNRADINHWEEMELAQTIEYTEHLELAPAGFRLLASKDEKAESYLGPLRVHLFGCAQRSKEVREMLVDYLTKQGKRRDDTFFSLWAKRHVLLTESEVSKLMSSDDLWIRAHTYDLFPDKCSNDSKERLQQDLRALRKLTGDLDK
jgi:hypothetical protein